MIRIAALGGLNLDLRVSEAPRELTSCDFCGGGCTDYTCEQCYPPAHVFAFKCALPGLWMLAHNLAIAGGLYVSHAHGSQRVVAYRPHGAVEDAALRSLWSPASKEKTDER